VVSSPLPTINALKQPTSDAWVEQARTNLDIILLHHSHCERKAAGVSLNFMFRYPSNAKMLSQGVNSAGTGRTRTL
jgi:tRNA-(ms[2]io[6]A)-hydroxylase